MDLTLPVKCEMCGAAVRKEGAAVPKEAKRPPDEDAAQPAAAKKQVTGALAAVVGSMAKGSTGPAVRPMGMVLDVVGTARGDRGRNCDEHEICGEVLAEDVVVRLRREQSRAAPLARRIWPCSCQGKPRSGGGLGTT